MTPPINAFFPIALAPARAANKPPVAAPDNIAFHGSSFFLIAEKLQSNDEYNTPHTAKLPPNIGTRALVLAIAAENLVPLGAFLKPPIECHTVPPYDVDDDNDND